MSTEDDEPTVEELRQLTEALKKMYDENDNAARKDTERRNK